jgi:polyhydroxyalkanoate synthesis repressor PhaR
MERKKIVIKKYENRRLYDTTNSRYVNLDEVARAVQNGYEVQVVDAATGEDISRLILTQIIVENAREPDSPFPLDILRQMIIASGRAGQEGARKYMNAIFDVYQTASRVIPQTLSPFDLMGNIMARGTGETAGKPESAPSATRAAHDPSSTGEPAGSELSELKTRLEALEAKIREKKRGGSKKSVARAKKTVRRKKP